MVVELPVDIFLAILGRLSPEDILQVRQTCKYFSEMTHLRSLWHHLMQSHVLARNIPVPGLHQRPLESLTAKEIERCIFQALKFQRNWISESPMPTTEVSFSAIPNSRIVSLQFLSDSDCLRLISLSLVTSTTGADRLFILQCWDFQTPSPTCIALRELRQFGSMVVNKSPSGSAVLAVQSPHIQILSISPSASNPVDGFVTLANFPDDTSVLHLLSGLTLLTSDARARSQLWHMENPQTKIELQNPDHHQTEPVLAALLDEQFAVIVRSTTLEVYELSPMIPSAIQKIVLHPIVQYRWPWRIDTVVISPQVMWPRTPLKLPAPINILIRFGSLFPWPINLLHYYELRPDTFYIRSNPIDKENLPFQFPPILRQMIGSPVRLFAPTDMVLGSCGSAIWIDSHTEDYFGHSDRGQRLAGRVSTAVITEDYEDEEVILSDQTASTAATSVYKFQETDSWVRLTLEEAEGRIAVGYVDGKISILSYAG